MSNKLKRETQPSRSRVERQLWQDGLKVDPYIYLKIYVIQVSIAMANTITMTINKYTSCYYFHTQRQPIGNFLTCYVHIYLKTIFLCCKIILFSNIFYVSTFI